MPAFWHYGNTAIVANICTKYEKDPSSGSKVMERTRFVLQTDGRLDRRKKWNQYPPNFVGEGYKNELWRDVFFTSRGFQWGGEFIKLRFIGGGQVITSYVFM